MFTRATPSFIGKEWFGTVSIGTEDDMENIYYGQLRLLFSCNFLGEQNQTVAKDLCFVRLYEIVQFHTLLKCPELKWQGDDLESYAVVEVASILKAVQIIPNFQLEGHFFVNVYKF
jgi:hypothetical protein